MHIFIILSCNKFSSPGEEAKQIASSASENEMHSQCQSHKVSMKNSYIKAQK